MTTYMNTADEEDQDTIDKHIAKAFSNQHITEQANLRIAVSVEQERLPKEWLLLAGYDRKITLPIDFVADFLTRLERYLTTNPEINNIR